MYVHYVIAGGKIIIRVACMVANVMLRIQTNLLHIVAILL